jgi:hypothetical protein
MKLRIFSLSLCLIFTAHGERESLVSEDVYQQVHKSIRDYWNFYLKADTLKVEEVRENAFAGLDDREKIRALAEWIFRKSPPHDYGIAWQATRLLRAPESVIQDYSELRRLMTVETDSRRFYQLNGLSTYGEKMAMISLGNVHAGYSWRE